ncbi:Citrate synthase, mitochondrial [Thelohanellus kitauei]|uniref:Citrate synthase n=1 Tax=Thelohanellus kitauei TaxID=669202 RepID=A0A0C2M3X2_THEKT|nr:Citrate synthase, mitochondrial [Thelohanellus kitauei]
MSSCIFRSCMRNLHDSGEMAWPEKADCVIGCCLSSMNNLMYINSSTLFVDTITCNVHKGPSRHDFLKERLVDLVPAVQTSFKDFKKQYSDQVIDTITVGQLLGGMRDIKCLYHEPSLLDKNEGITFRNMRLDEIKTRLCYEEISGQPLPEAVFWLLLTGEVPTLQQVKWLSGEWARRAELPYYLVNIINSFPDNLHPMAKLSASVTLLSRYSKFSLAYEAGGVPKTELWKPMYEDCMNLIAKLPVIAGLIYRNTFHDGCMGSIDPENDWSKNYAKLLNINKQDDFVEYMRLYLAIHADHEGGNASSHTASLVGSTLSDVFLSYAAAMNALAGPLHGRANQEVVDWIETMLTTLKQTNPSEETIESYCVESLKSSVIPGFGHAVLRKTDPRYTLIRGFAEKHLQSNVSIEVVDKVKKVVTKLLSNSSKVKNPWPNVDGISGTVFKELNLHEYDYYTVPFGVSRALGICSAIIWARALALPLERPKSMDMKELVGTLKK